MIDKKTAARVSATFPSETISDDIIGVDDEIEDNYSEDFDWDLPFEL